MQDFLTICAESVAVAGFVLIATQFVLGILSRHQKGSTKLEIDWAEPKLKAVTEAIEDCWLTAQQIEPAQVAIEDSIAPFTRKAPSLAGLKIRQLKAIASVVKLPRYNKCTIAQLQQRLASEVPVWRLKEAIATL